MLANFLFILPSSIITSL